MTPVSWPQVLLNSFRTAALVWTFYRLCKAAYNIFLHPLRSIPGPKLAAASYLPEFYYDVICVGRYTAEIRKMHEIYGKLLPGDAALLPQAAGLMVTNVVLFLQDLSCVLIRMSCIAMIPPSSTRYTQWPVEKETSRFIK